MLGVVTKVQPDEVATDLLMTRNVLMLLMVYPCVKPVQEAWILAQPGGAEYEVCFFVRTENVMSAPLVFVGLHTLGLSMRGSAVVNGILVVVWLLLAILEERSLLSVKPEEDPTSR